jgi:glycosyltransferase involved in cell wall biosynthesis
MHLLTLCRLATVKAQAKHQALVDSDSVDELTIVRHRPVPLDTSKPVNQVAYLMNFPDSVHDFTPLMRLRNHVGMFVNAARAIRKYDPDVVYGIFLVPYGLFAWILSRFFRKPCIISLIGTDLNDYTLRRFTAPFFKRMLRHVELITVVDEDSQWRLIETGVDASRVMVLPNAVDLRPYKMNGRSFKKDFDAIYTGRLLDMKEPQNLIQVWRHVVAGRPGSRLALVGDGVMRAALEALTAKYNLTDNIHFAGWVDDVPAWIARARVFLSVSSQEGVPTAMIEAMAGGLVPVHTRVGGVPYVLHDGENGYLVDYPTDVYFTARRIIQLLDDEARYSQMQQNALKVHQQFGLTGVTEAWNEILKRFP